MLTHSKTPEHHRVSQGFALRPCNVPTKKLFGQHVGLSELKTLKFVEVRKCPAFGFEILDFAVRISFTGSVCVKCAIFKAKRKIGLTTMVKT